MALAPEQIGEAEVRAAAETIAGRVRETPVLPSGELSRRLGARVVLKAENLQLTGSFKARGATNAISRLSDAELAAGVVAASAGNHAQAVAFAARAAGTQALLVMPERASLAKVAAVRQYGGEVTFVDGGYDEAQAEAARLSRERGMREIHAFDQPDVVAGQGTVGLELARQAPDTRLVVVPLGGGGLAGGIAPGGGRRAAESARRGRAGGRLRSLHRLARGAPARGRALRQHHLRRDRGEAPGGLHAAARRALRGRGRDGVRRPGGRGHGAAPRALEARGGGGRRGGRGGADARPRGAAR